MDRSIPRGLRAFFLLITIEALVVAAGLIWPALIPRLIPWDASPLNARFIGALYAMGTLSALLATLARTYDEVRITLISIAVITLLILLVTLAHLGEFAPPRSFPAGWLLSYLADPILAGLLLWQLRRRAWGAGGRNTLTTAFRIYAAVMGTLGIILLTLPSLAARIWPWELPASLGQLYSAFLIGLAVCAVIASREAEWENVRIYTIANLSMLVLVVIVSLVHFDRFRPGVATWLWFGFCLAGIAAFAAALLRRTRQAALRGSLS
jgi:hypothetical protein